MESLMKMNCTEFSEVLASKQSVPGGGGAASYVGALGIALASMSANFTSGKKKYACYQKDIDRILKEADQIRIRLLELVDQDAMAFEPLSKAYKIPKDDIHHDEILEQATINALQAPVEMVKECAKAIDLLEELSHKCTPLLISDVACGASLCKCAMESAAINVFINTSSLKDQTLKAKIESEIDSLLFVYAPKASQIKEDIIQTIRR